MARVIQDRITPDGTGRTKHKIALDTPPNCLSINKDCSQVVVAGRNVFKIFAIEDGFVEKINLRAVRNPNLSYCTSDVAWNHGEDHILASASTNGAVVVWNLNMASRSKQEQVLADHKRTATRVNFHKFEHHLLISGSLDGYMKLFDLRKKEVSSSFNGNSDAIRDVQFNPHQYFQFAAAFDSGNVQIWDLRYPTRMERQFTAHNGPCFCLDWHPEDPAWLATAGRDKIIKVWDMPVPNPPILHQFQTIASVAQIKWRPQRKHHIASCAFILDSCVNVWDIRRPYIPFAAFEDHKDVVTGIVWRPSDPHMFYSTSKDCTLYQHVFRDATRPADKANPVGVDISIMGTVVLATHDKLVTAGTRGPNTRLPQFFRRGPDRREQFTKVTSICNEFGLVEDLSVTWLIDSAKQYRLSGKSVEELCEHNGKVAEQLGRHEVATVWHMLQMLYSNTTALESDPAFSGHKQDSKEIDSDHKVKNEKPTVSQDTKNQGEDTKDRHKGDTSTGVSDEESDAAESDQPTKAVDLTTIASGLGNRSHSDFFFGDGTIDQGVFDYENLDNITSGQDWNLPIEAFQPRIEIDERPTSPDPIAHHNGGVDSPSSTNDSEFNTVPQTVPENISIKQEILGCLPFLKTMPAWQFTHIISEVMNQFAEKGDVQTCVAILIILGDKISPHIDDLVQEQWLMSYIDLLGHFQLWSEAAEVIKLSNHPRVSALNQQTTMIKTNCTNCNKPLQRQGWLCDRCKGYVNTCSICHHPVKGLYVWCQGCSHGGHLQHIQDWLQTHKECPAGCGHLCEYST